MESLGFGRDLIITFVMRKSFNSLMMRSTHSLENRLPFSSIFASLTLRSSVRKDMNNEIAMSVLVKINFVSKMFSNFKTVK